MTAAMPESAAVFIIVVRVVFSIFGNDFHAGIVPKDAVAFASERDCKASVPAVRRDFQKYKTWVTSMTVGCEKMDIRK